jgi:hypothetical protein
MTSKNDVNVTSNISSMKKIIFVEDPDPHPESYENVTDPEHCKIGRKGKRDDQTQWSQLGTGLRKSPK